MIKQPISIVDTVDEFGQSTHLFSSCCFDNLESLSHLKTFSLNGSIAQVEFDCALLVYKEKNWLLFTHFKHLIHFLNSESKIDSNSSNYNSSHYKVLSEENVKEICHASEFKAFCDLCAAAPQIIVQLQNIYQCNETGIPGVVDEKEAMQILAESHQRSRKKSKKRKAIDVEKTAGKKTRIQHDSSEEEEEEFAKELTLEDVLEPVDSPATQEHHSFGVKVTVLVHNEFLMKIFQEPEKLDAIRKFTATKTLSTVPQNQVEINLKQTLVECATKAVKAIVSFEEYRKSADPQHKNSTLLQPPLVEQGKLFPNLTSEHGFRFSLFDYQRRLLYWMLQRERQTLLYSAWPAVHLNESNNQKFDDLVAPAKVQITQGATSHRYFFINDGLLTLGTKNPSTIRLSQRNDEFLDKFCKKTYPSIMAASHYPHKIQHICRLLFSKQNIHEGDFLTEGFDCKNIPSVFTDDKTISLSESDEEELPPLDNHFTQLDSTASAQLLNVRVLCNSDHIKDCHGNCKAMQDYRAKETANLNYGTEECPLTILIEALLKMAQSTALKVRQKEVQSYVECKIANNPYFFRCGVSCGKTGCGKTTMKIALIYVTKLWEDVQPESARETLLFGNNFDALLPISRRPLKLSSNSQTDFFKKSRQSLYYANCTLVVCPEQVVEQWFMEFVKTIGSGTLKKRPANGKNRAVLNGGVFGEIIDEDENILLNIAVIRDYSALRQVELCDIIERLDVLIVNQTLFRSTAYRENFKRNPVNAELKQEMDIGERLFDRPKDHSWIYGAVAFERKKMAAAEVKLEQSMLDQQQQQYDFDSIPKPGFSMGRTLLHAIHWRRIVIDEAHLLSVHITPVERAVSALSADFTWLVTATANFQARGSFRRFNKHNEGGYGALLHIPLNDDRLYLESHIDYRAQFVQQCSATTSYEALPQLFLHRVPVHFTPEETAIYASLRSGIKNRMLRLLFCSHHMLNDQIWVSKNLDFNERPEPNESKNRGGDVVGAMMTVGEVATSMQSARQSQIEKFNQEILDFNQYFAQCWLNLTTDTSVAEELLNEARSAIEKEILSENELEQNEPENIICSQKQIGELTRRYLGPITEEMLELWQRNPQVRIAMALVRLENNLARQAISLRARYSTGVSKTRLPIVRNRERTLAEYDFFRRIFERLGKPDEIVECPVCLSDDHTKKSIVLTVCGHEFCTECSKAMFKTKSECGVCRRKLVVPRDLRLVDRVTAEKKVDICDTNDASTTIVKAPNSVLETYGSKLAALITLIEKILKRRDCRKIIVFAQFQRLLVLIAGVLEKSGINFVVAKGSIRQSEKAFRAFRYDSGVKLILLSSEKSISGVHLVEANHMIAVHPTLCSRGVDEEVATFMQAVARMRRLMQQHDCHVWQLVTVNTIEEQQYAAQMTALRHKYAMDVGIHWNAALDEEEGGTAVAQVLQNTTNISAQDKSRQEFLNLLHGEDSIQPQVEEEEGEIDILLRQSIQNAKEKQTTVVEDETQEEQETNHETIESGSFTEWLNNGNYRK